MITNVVPESVLAAGTQMESLVLRIVDELAARAPEFVLVPPAGLDEGSQIASSFATTQGIDMFTNHLEGIYHVARSASSILEAGNDYLRDDALSASTMQTPSIG